MNEESFFKITKAKIILFLIISLPSFYLFIGDFIPRCMIAPYCETGALEIIWGYLSFLVLIPTFLLYLLIYSILLDKIFYWIFVNTSVLAYVWISLIVQLIYNLFMAYLLVYLYKKIKNWRESKQLKRKNYLKIKRD